MGYILTDRKIDELLVYRKDNSSDYYVKLQCNICREDIYKHIIDYKSPRHRYTKCSNGHFQLEENFKNKYPNLEKDSYFLYPDLWEDKPTYIKNKTRYILFKCVICNDLIIKNLSDYKKGQKPYECKKGHIQVPKEFLEKYPNFTKENCYLNGILINGKPQYVNISNPKYKKYLIRTNCHKCGKEMWYDSSAYVEKEYVPCCSRKCRPQAIYSKNEKFIEDWLIKNNVKYEREKTFNDLINPLTNYHLYFDFYLPKYNVVIEYQGEQHYKPIEWFGGVKEYLKIIERDQYKAAYTGWIKKFIFLELNFLLHKNKEEIENALNINKEIWDAIRT